MIDPPGFAARDPDFERRVRASFARQGFMALLGAELVRVEAGVCTIALPVRREVAQQHGVVHGGALTAVLDTACGYAALSLLRDGDEVVSAEFKTQMLEPARGARVVAVGRVVRPGRVLTVCSGEARSYAHPENHDGGAAREGALVALMSATMVRVDANGRPGGG